MGWDKLINKIKLSDKETDNAFSKLAKEQKGLKDYHMNQTGNSDRCKAVRDSIKTDALYTIMKERGMR